jgi:general secretion pathway protein A
MGYAEYWHCGEKPFEEVNDVRYFFQSEGHREALDRMCYVVNDRNMNISLLTGEIGSGKTITKNVFLRALPPKEFQIVDFENSNFAFQDLCYDVVRKIARDNPLAPPGRNEDLPDRGDRYGLMNFFRQQLEFLTYEENRHLVLVFDEAQQMDDRILDEVKNLTNFSSKTENFLTIFLVGQPELREKVKHLRQVDQRIFLRFHLNNLDFKNSVDYIHHRLRVAECSDGGVFGEQAYELIFRATGGIPREINRICKLAMNYGFAQNLRAISENDVRIILDDMKVQGG